MSLSGDLCLGTVRRIVDRLDLKEVEGPDGPALTLTAEHPEGKDGVCRVWEGGPLSRMVYIGLEFPPMQLDSHMVFAFGPTDSIVPHFTLDSVFGHGTYAFHLDLIPRVDLGANLDHMDEVWEPLTDTFHTFGEDDRWKPARLTPRQRALMSPWMLANHGDEAAFAELGPTVDAYLSRWFEVVEAGVTAAVRSIDPTERDLRNRTALFSPEVDRVWDSIRPIIGTQNVDRARALLRGEELTGALV